MLSKHNNMTAFWFALGFREVEAYEATSGFNEASYRHHFIVEHVHIIEDDETSYCKLSNPWKSEPQMEHTQEVLT